MKHDVDRTFITDTEGLITDVALVATKKRLDRALHGQRNILYPLKSFIEKTAPGMRIHIVTEQDAITEAMTWLDRVQIPTGVEINIQNIVDPGKIGDAEWFRDHVLPWSFRDLDCLAAPSTDQVSTGMHQVGIGEHAKWVSQKIGYGYEDLRKFFLPGGSLLSGNNFWVTRRGRNPEEALSRLSSERLLFCDYRLSDLAFSKDAAFDAIEVYQQHSQRAKTLSQEDIVSSRHLPNLSRDTLRGRQEENGGYLSFGYHVDMYFALTPFRKNAKPVALLAERIPIGLPSLYSNLVLGKEAEFLNATQLRLEEQGFFVIRNKIPVAPEIHFSEIRDRLYNNVLVESSTRFGESKPLVWMPTFGDLEPELEEFDRHNRDIWNSLGCKVVPVMGWSIASLALGALRCAVGVLARS